MTKIYISDCYAWPELRTVDGDKLIAVCQEYSRDNARRLVAAWNAFDGVPTENIEGKSVAEYVASDAYINGLDFVDGGAEIELSGTACQLLAESFAGQFKGSGAINYLEVRMYHKDLGPFAVNIQRSQGETPGQQLAACKAELDSLRAVNAELLAAVEHVMRCIPIGGFAQIHYDSATWAQLDAAIAGANQAQKGGA